LGTGTLKSSPTTFFLITEFLELSNWRFPALGTLIDTFLSRESLARQLAKLHTTPAPIPDGYTAPQFGFPATTCCGDSLQDNTFKTSWADFYAENRLRYILGRAEEKNGKDAALRKMVELTISAVVPRLLGDAHLNKGKGVTPVVVHGDLWSGNAGRTAGGDIIFDPSSCYAHSEYEIGIMRMFGGFGSSFFKIYHEVCPKSEPVEEYEDRVSLYELWVAY